MRSAGTAPSNSIRPASLCCAISASSCAAAASIARAVAGDRQPPRQIGERRQRRDQHVVALARHHRADRQAAARCRRCCPCAVAPRSVPGQRDGDEVRRNVVVVDQQLRGRRAGDDDAVRGGQRRRARSSEQLLGVRWRQARFPAPADDAPARSADVRSRERLALPPAARRSASPSITIGHVLRHGRQAASRAIAFVSALGRGKPSPRAMTSTCQPSFCNSAIMRRS